MILWTFMCIRKYGCIISGVVEYKERLIRWSGLIGEAVQQLVVLYLLQDVGIVNVVGDGVGDRVVSGLVVVLECVPVGFPHLLLPHLSYVLLFIILLHSFLLLPLLLTQQPQLNRLLLPGFCFFVLHVSVPIHHLHFWVYLCFQSGPHLLQLLLPHVLMLLRCPEEWWAPIVVIDDVLFYFVVLLLLIVPEVPHLLANWIAPLFADLFLLGKQLWVGDVMLEGGASSQFPFELVLIEWLTCLPGDSAGVMINFEQVDSLWLDVLAELLTMVLFLLVVYGVVFANSFHLFNIPHLQDPSITSTSLK